MQPGWYCLTAAIAAAATNYHHHNHIGHGVWHPVGLLLGRRSKECRKNAFAKISSFFEDEGKSRE